MIDIVRRYQIHRHVRIYRNTKNVGMVRNHNICAELARGKYIAFLHDDDMLLPNYLRKVEKYLYLNYDNLYTSYYNYYPHSQGSYLKQCVKHFVESFFLIKYLFRHEIEYVFINDVLRSGIRFSFTPSCGNYSGQIYLKKWECLTLRKICF